MSWTITEAKFTCKDCPDRYPGCWGSCEKYRQERAEYDRLKAIADAKRNSDRYTARAIADNRDRTARTKREYMNRQWRR